MRKEEAREASRMSSQIQQRWEKENEINWTQKTPQIWEVSRSWHWNAPSISKGPLGICAELVTEWVTALQDDWGGKFLQKHMKQAGAVPRTKNTKRWDNPCDEQGLKTR